jgi:hypothetical protein
VEGRLPIEEDNVAVYDVTVDDIADFQVFC